MKKAIGIGIALLALVSIIGCKPISKDVTGSLNLSTDVETLKSDVENLSNQVSDLQASISDLTTSLDSLTTAFEDHMKKFHSTTTVIPRPTTKPTTGGTGTTTRHHVK